MKIFDYFLKLNINLLKVFKYRIVALTKFFQKNKLNFV